MPMCKCTWASFLLFFCGGGGGRGGVVLANFLFSFSFDFCLCDSLSSSFPFFYLFFFYFLFFFTFFCTSQCIFIFYFFMGCAHLPLACIIIIFFFEVSMQRFFFFLIQKYVTFLFYLMVDINCKFIPTSFSILSIKQISFSSLQFSILPIKYKWEKTKSFLSSYFSIISPFFILSFFHSSNQTNLD